MSAEKKQNEASQKEASNFHVLPKKDTAKEQGKQPATENDAAQSDVISRDADAGVVGSDSQVNQPTRDTGYDRSQVS